MTISDASKRGLNEMCPAAREAQLGAAVQTAETNVSSLQTSVGILQAQVSELEGNVGDPVQDIAALKAVVAADREDKQLRAVEDVEAVYIFDAESIGAGDDDLIVVPDDVTPPDPGRWLKTGGAGAAGDISYDNSGSGLVADNVQDAIDEVYGAIPEEIPIYEVVPGERNLVVRYILSTALNSPELGSAAITAADVIKSIHGVPVEPITYFLRKFGGVYGPGNTNPRLEFLTFDCNDVGAGPETLCYAKIIDSTDPVPVEWCEVEFLVHIVDGADDCAICGGP